MTSKASATGPGESILVTEEVSHSIPLNWPIDLPYLSQPLYSSSIPSIILHTLHNPPAVPPESPQSITIIPSTKLPPLPNPSIIIQAITSHAHPAHGQHGLFAAIDLQPDSLITLYTGLVYLAGVDTNVDTEKGPRQAHAESNYDLALYRDPEGEYSISIDAANMGNEGRFVNDYRGVPVVDTSSHRSSQPASSSSSSSSSYSAFPSLKSISSSASSATSNHSKHKPKEQKRFQPKKNEPNVEFREVWIKRKTQLRITNPSNALPASRDHQLQQNTSASPDIPNQCNKPAVPEESQSIAESDQDPPLTDSSPQPWSLTPYERCIGIYTLSAGRKAGTKRARGVLRGEELLVSYGKGFWSARADDGDA